jgi:DNA-binding winged helix-turn-helix (wHTH) protein
LERAKAGIEVAGIGFDVESGTLSRGRATAKLEPKAADVLAFLFAERGRVVSRERLLDQCWGEGSGSDEGLTQVIAQIRRSLDALGAPRELLSTYPKRGYRLTTGGEENRGSEPSRASIAPWVAVGLLVIAAFAVLIFAPHWPRHLIRHALGLGPNHAQFE